MPDMTFQIEPPLKFCGEVVISDHISVILSFQVENAFSRLATIQLSLKGNSPPFFYAYTAVCKRRRLNICGYIIIFIRTFILSELCLESLDFMPFSSQNVQIIFRGILLYFYTSAIPQIQKVRIIRHFNPYSFFSVTSSETVKRELSALMPEYIVF